jgi:hypothetical protein
MPECSVFGFVLNVICWPKEAETFDELLALLKGYSCEQVIVNVSTSEGMIEYSSRGWVQVHGVWTYGYEVSLLETLPVGSVEVALPLRRDKLRSLGFKLDIRGEPPSARLAA